MTAKKQGLMKDGTRRPPARGGRGGGMPRIMWLAILVSIVGAVFLFRTRSAEIPAGIGENQTVVTAPDVESTLSHEDGSHPADGPHSGDVDIGNEAAALTPEQPAEDETDKAAAATSPEQAEPAKTVQAPVTKPAARPAEQKTKTPKPVEEQILPAENGPYVVQIGSFGNATNADQEAVRLQKLGWNALVKMGNTSSGDIIHRVHIGYFGSRAEAEKFIGQNRHDMGNAIAIHR